MNKSCRFAAGLLAIVLASVPARAQDLNQQIEHVVRTYSDAELFHGSVLVAQGDEVIYSAGIGDANKEWGIPNTPETRFRIGSVTKQFTAALILRLAEEGLIDVQAPVTTYLPDYPTPQGNLVTIHHLLSHTSGIPNFTNFPEYAEIKRDPFRRDSLIDRFARLELLFEPGEQWSYSNSGYYLLGVIIERVTGETYDRVLKEWLLDPLGLEDTGYDHYSEIIENRASGYQRIPSGFVHAEYIDTSVPFAAGMMYATVGDLHRWTTALHGGKVFQTDASYELMISPVLQGYGYGIAEHVVGIGDEEVKIIGHSGGIDGFTSQLWYEPEGAYTIAVLDNTMTNVAPLMDAILHVVHGAEAPDPVKPISALIGKTIEEAGIDAAEDRYRELRRSAADDYVFNEWELNNLGYYYLRQGDVETAIRVFKLNVEAYPEAANPYDSLGEAYLEAGQQELAVENYRKALELNPGNENARAVLVRLGVDVQDRPVEVPASVLDSYAGVYELQPGFRLTVTREGDALFVQATGQPRFQVYPRSETEFYYKVVDAQLTFERDEGGAVENVVLHQHGLDMPAKRVE